MLEGAVMEYVKWFIGVLSIMFIAVAVVFMFRLNELNSFQQEVNYQIERHGGLTTEALHELDDHAKIAYGGYLAKSSDDNAGPLFSSDNGQPSSGFFVREYVINGDGTTSYHTRGTDATDQENYGTPVRYVITRQIGDIDGVSFFKPAVFGVSASRVRGTDN